MKKILFLFLFGALSMALFSHAKNQGLKTVDEAKKYYMKVYEDLLSFLP